MADTTLVRLTNDRLARLLHQPLYQRMLSFCEQYTPEFPADVIVQAWMQRLYGGDSNLHILVRLDAAYNIVGHAVIDVQDTYGHKVVYCHQACGDKRNISHVDEGAEYIDKLAQHVGAVCSVFFTEKHSKSLQQKYGYHVSRIAMIKQYGGQYEDLEETV